MSQRYFDLRISNLDITSLEHLASSDFLINASNAEACQLIDNWAASWGIAPYPNIVRLIGAYGVGKTFTAQMWADRSKAHFLKEQDIFSVDTNVQHIIIDNLDCWLDQDLVHIFNVAAAMNNKRVLLIQDYNFKSNLEDLSTRLNSVKTIEILPPDESTMSIAILLEFKKFFIIISHDVAEFIAKRIKRNFHAVCDVVAKLDYYAIQTKSAITVPFIKKAIENHIIEL